MASRDDEDDARHPPSRWEGEAPRASRPLGAEPWRRESAQETVARVHTGGDVRAADAPHASGWGGAQVAGTGGEPQGGAPAGVAYGSGRWGLETPSGYSGPSGTGYGQTCQGQSGYGQGGQGEPGPAGHGDGVSYAGTAGYAGYAGAHHTCTASAPAPGETARARPDLYDIDYRQWRDEQLRKLDADYQTWRQSRYRQFADEFNAWRSSRQDTAGAARADAPRPPATASTPTDPSNAASPRPGADLAPTAGHPSLSPSSQPK